MMRSSWMMLCLVACVQDTTIDERPPPAAPIKVSVLDGCTGPSTLEIEGLTPSGDYGIMMSRDDGTAPLPPQAPCSGRTRLFRPGLTLALLGTADHAGRVSRSVTLPPAVCRQRLIQVVDVDSCEMSNLAALPSNLGTSVSAPLQLKGITHVDADVFLNGPALNSTSVALLRDVRVVDGDLAFQAAPGTTNLAMDSLEEVTGDLRLSLSDLQSVDFPSLRRIGGRLIVDGTLLQSLDGFSALEELGSLDIHADHLLGLSGLAGISGELSWLQVSTSDALTSLDGLEGITAIRGDLFVQHNPLLSDISGLYNITEVDGRAVLTGNTSLCGGEVGTFFAGLTAYGSGTAGPNCP